MTKHGPTPLSGTNQCNLGINHRTVAAWVKQQAGTAKPENKEHKIELIAAGVQRPLHDMGGSLCIRGITQGNE